MIKKIDQLLIKSFLPPFLLAFLIAMFVLVMQLLWGEIDSIMSKGVGMLLLLELIGYLGMALLPLALAIGVLISSVMVFGNLAERYELASMKSAGLSLWRILIPLVILCSFISLFSFYCSNTLIPYANLKAKTRINDINRARPTLNLEEGVFNDDFEGFTIRIGDKDEDGRHVQDVMLYDHSDESGGRMRMTVADRGEMYVTENGETMVVKLYDGHQYREEVTKKDVYYPFIKAKFTSYEKQFDLRQFEVQESNEDRYKKQYKMLSVSQLKEGADSLRVRIERHKEKAAKKLLPSYVKIKKGSKTVGKSKGMRPLNLKEGKEVDLTGNQFIDLFPLKAQVELTNKMKRSVDRRKSVIRSEISQREYKSKNLLRHIYERQVKYADSLICLIFLFIGAPMGAIIRKGGYGYPLLVTILFFMGYVVIKMTFHEMMKIGKFDPILAAWIPDLIVLPVGIFLTVKAMNDSALFSTDWIKKRIRNFKK